MLDKNDWIVPSPTATTDEGDCWIEENPPQPTKVEKVPARVHTLRLYFSPSGRTYHAWLEVEKN